MCPASNSFFLNELKKISFIATLFIFVGLSSHAFATFIDFEELAPGYYSSPHNTPCECSLNLDDQYLDKGVQFADTWIVGDIDSGYKVLAGLSPGIFFTGGTLPTFFSMDVTSLFEDAMTLNIYSPSGLLSTIITSGWTISPSEEYDPPPKPEFVSFSSELGISAITIQGIFNRRFIATLDNLTVTNTSVPEPSPLVLFTIGLLGLAWRRYRAQTKPTMNLGRTVKAMLA